MRPLRLEIESFGPFVAIQDISFQEAERSGLFLIQGPTGSGKTSVLDAVCFALFGDASGGERQPAGLRSHHASETAVTRVRLTFALGEEVFRVQRSMPGRARTPTVKASLELLLPEDISQRQERPEGDGFRVLRVLTEKAGEVTDRIRDLLHLDLEQFRQVIILPQGKFRDFLVAKSKDREGILEKLFDMERFDKLIGLLAAETAQVKETLRDLETSRKSLLAEFGSDDPQEIPAKIASLVSTLAEKEIVKASIRKRLATARAQLQQGLKDEETYLRLQDNTYKLAELKAKEKEIGTWRATLASADKASRITAHFEHRAQLAESLRLAVARCEAARQTLETSLQKRSIAEVDFQDAEREAGSLTSLAAAQEAVRNLAAAFKRLILIEERERNLASQAVRREKEVTIRAGEEAELNKTSKDMETRILSIENRMVYKDRILGLHSFTKDRSQYIERVQALAAKQREIEADIRDITLRQASDRQELVQDEHTLRDWEAAIRGAEAAHMAVSLMEGHPCPVCGSTHHPAPAETPSFLPPADRLDSLRKDAENMREGLTRLEVRKSIASQELSSILAEIETVRHLLAEAETAITVAAEGFKDFPFYSGEPASFAEEWVNRLAEEALAREKLIKEQRIVLAKLDQVRAAHQDALMASNNIKGELDRLNFEVAEARTDVTRFQDSLMAEGSLVDCPQDAAGAEAAARILKEKQDSILRLRNLKADELSLARTAEAVAVETVTREEAEISRLTPLYEQANKTWITALRDSGFHNEASWHNALLPQDELHAKEKEVEEYDRGVLIYAEAIRELEKEWSDKEPSDIAGLKEACSILEAEETQADREAGALTEGIRRAEAAQNSLSGIHDAYEAADAEFRRLHSLHILLSGQDSVAGSISLRRYALSVFLDDILDHANRHLHLMSAGRYRIRRLDEATDKRKTGGLELSIADEYTGSERGTETLSGGESFMAALSLALGMSSVVHIRSGGVRLDTLFIDEGFGSLDEEALQEAMVVIEGLKEKGRTVGIISHVRELQERIPTQLCVKTSPQGSRLYWKTI